MIDAFHVGELEISASLLWSENLGAALSTDISMQTATDTGR